MSGAKEEFNEFAGVVWPLTMSRVHLQDCTTTHKDVLHKLEWPNRASNNNEHLWLDVLIHSLLKYSNLSLVLVLSLNTWCIVL